MAGIVLVDYHKGNIRSVEKALQSLGVDVIVSDDPASLKKADGIVLPGVGAFYDAATTLLDLGLTQPLIHAIESGVPFLGICLGMQLLFEGGKEHAQKGAITEGFSIMPGIVERIPRTDASGRVYKIPHVGWNRVDLKDGSCPLFDNVDDGSYFYFTHSYMVPDGEYTVATSTHSVTIPCAVRKGNAFGVQFHPEKSSDKGLVLLESFIDIVSG